MWTNDMMMMKYCTGWWFYCGRVDARHARWRCMKCKWEWIIGTRLMMAGDGKWISLDKAVKIKTKRERGGYAKEEI